MNLVDILTYVCSGAIVILVSALIFLKIQEPPLSYSSGGGPINALPEIDWNGEYPESEAVVERLEIEKINDWLNSDFR